MSATRRVYFYIITLITLGIFAAGLGQLLSLLFDITIKGSALAQVGRAVFNRQQLSLGLAMLVIGGPLWFFFWRAIQGRVAGVPEEIGAGMRKVFLNLILTVSALTGLVAASNFLRWLLSGVPAAQFSSGGLATVIVTGLIWYYHWRVSEAEGHPSPDARTLRRWYIYILSGFGLVWLTLGPVQLINIASLNLPIWGSAIVRGPFWNSAFQMRIAWIVLGGLAWYFHWLRIARDDFDSTLRQVYFYLLAILGGAIAALVALSISFYRVFLWGLGGVVISTGAHFQFLGWAIPTILMGAAVWSYHQWLAQEEAARVNERRFSAQRVHLYLMSFLGLGTLIAGLIILFGVIVDFIINATAPPVAVTPGWWRNQLSLCLALLLVGAPLWLYYWSRVLRRAEASGVTEWRARSRRIFLYVIVGASIVTLAADLVNVVYQLLNGMLQGTFDIKVLRNSKWSIQTLIVAAPLLWYHWQIVRGEQRRGAEAAAVHKSVVLLAGDRAAELAIRLEDKLGYKIRVLNRVGDTGEEIAALPDEELDKLIGEIQAAPGTKVMLVAQG
ncbi:MAG: DUF5671 domain-containing protein, partial [Chloroflexota bacterium]|nr:DUF5671 domain-containing protein [Chloroflexota bacterium]